MSNTDYILQRDNIIEQYQNHSLIYNNEFLYGQYNIVSANLLNFLPDISPDKHIELFEQILVHKKLSKLEQNSDWALRYLKTENLQISDLEELKSKPAIICTFHTGSYRIINAFLVKNKVPYTLVIGNSIIAEEGQDYYTQYHGLAGHDSTNGFNIIDAENPRSGLQMLRELKKGKCLLLYIDGNTGAGDSTINNDNKYAINFLEQQLFARKGIGFLAHAANVPIIPVINYREGWNDIRLRFYKAIIPDPSESREVFSKKVIQCLYDTVAPVIKKYPEQWEAWLYLHKVANVSNCLTPLRGKANGKLVRFNLRDYGVFSINKKKFLFQKNNYTSYPINNSLYAILKDSIEYPFDKSKLRKSVFKELEGKGVLHYL